MGSIVWFCKLERRILHHGGHREHRDRVPESLTAATLTLAFRLCALCVLRGEMNSETLGDLLPACQRCADSEEPKIVPIARRQHPNVDVREAHRHEAEIRPDHVVLVQA